MFGREGYVPDLDFTARFCGKVMIVTVERAEAPSRPAGTGWRRSLPRWRRQGNGRCSRGPAADLRGGAQAIDGSSTRGSICIQGQARAPYESICISSSSIHGPHPEGCHRGAHEALTGRAGNAPEIATALRARFQAEGIQLVGLRELWDGEPGAAQAAE